MVNSLAFVGCTIFVILALWHFYWAFGGSVGKSAAVPEIDGAPAFTPSAVATIFVGIVLLLFALLLVAASGLVAVPLPTPILVWLCYGLAAVLLARAIGEFRLVGFFKRVRGSVFARLDSWFYSPLCIVLSGIAYVVGRGSVA